MSETDWLALVNHRTDQLKAAGMPVEEAADTAMLEIRELGEALHRRREALLLNFHASDPRFDSWTKLPGVGGALTEAWSIEVEDLVGGKAIIPPYGLDTVCKEDLAYRIFALAQMVSDIGFANLLRPVRGATGT